MQENQSATDFFPSFSLIAIFVDHSGFFEWIKDHFLKVVIVTCFSSPFSLFCFLQLCEVVVRFSSSWFLPFNANDS